MFQMGVESRVFGQIYGILMMTTSQYIFVLLIAQFKYEISHPYNLLTCFSSSNIFSLSGWEDNAFLELRLQRHCWAYKV